MNCSNNLNGCELVALSSTLAIYIASNLNASELSIWASFFTSLGDNLATMAITCAEENNENT